MAETYRSEAFWDEDVLASWEEDADAKAYAEAGQARDASVAAIRECDFALSETAVSRAMADEQHGWRRCRLKSCRRSRRCCTTLNVCITVRHAAWSHADQVFAVDDYYAELQQERRRQALEAGWVDEADLEKYLDE